MTGNAPAPHEHIAIIGGGFTGAALALHLVRNGHQPGRISVFEPRHLLGAGVAYTSTHPDHRFNGPLDLLALFPEDMSHFLRWYRSSGAEHQDSAAMASTGQIYARRSDFGRYMAWLLETHAPGLRHVREEAIDIEPWGNGYLVRDKRSGKHAADRVYLCTAQDAPRMPKAFDALGVAPGVVPDPWAPDALEKVPPQGDVLLLGTALTAVDVAAALLCQPRQGRIVAVSRRGLTPRPQERLPPPEERMAKFLAGTPAFLARHGKPATARGMLRAAREWLEAGVREGRRWQDVFDDIRDGLSPIWSAWPLAERRRALRHLRAYYDVHRYRMAPQLSELMMQAEAQGVLQFRRARAEPVNSAEGQHVIRLKGRGADETRGFAAIVNCTGPVADITASTNPVIKALLGRGLIQPDPTGLGALVDAQCRLVAPGGAVQPLLCAFGSLTRGRFGDLTAVPQINMQILKTLLGDPLGGKR